MTHKKSFNRSERAAILAVGELFKQGLVESGIFDFLTMAASPVEKDKSSEEADALCRLIYFRHLQNEAVVEVRTSKGKEYSDDHPDEAIFWNAVRAEVTVGGFAKSFRRTKYRDHIFWSREI